MSRALCQISLSPFSSYIEDVELPRCFTQPTFTIYNGKTDLMEHVSLFNQRMAFHSINEALMRQVFPSSLGPTAMREGKSLKTYSDRYWELFNEIDGDFEDVAVCTFKVGLPMSSGLRKSLTMKPAQDMHQLMDRIEEYKKVKDDQVQGKGKTKVFTPKQRDPRLDSFGPNRLRREFFNQAPQHNAHAVNSIFKKLVYQVLEKIKSKPYFKWPNKIGGGGLTRQNQSLYCQYHQDRGHTTKDCRTLRDFLNQLAKAGNLKQFMHQPFGQGEQSGFGRQRDTAPCPSLGTINVIFATLIREIGPLFRIMPISHKLRQERSIGKPSGEKVRRNQSCTSPRLVRQELSSSIMMPS